MTQRAEPEAEAAKLNASTILEVLWPDSSKVESGAPLPHLEAMRSLKALAKRSQKMKPVTARAVKQHYHVRQGSTCAALQERF